jgi:outer membrane protein
MGLATAREVLRRGGMAYRLAAMLAAFAAVPASAENIRDTLAQTYRYNPRLDAERANLRATDEGVSQANAGYRPSINAQADAGQQTLETTLSGQQGRSPQSGTTGPRGYTVRLTQPLFRGFQTLNGVNEAEAQVRAGRETLRDVEQEVLLEAVTQYGNVVRDQAIVRFRENNVTVLATELKATQDRFAVGEVTRTDVAQAQAARAQAISELELAKANLKVSRSAYEQTVGSPPRNLEEPRPETKLLPHSLDEGIAISSRENPKVVAALYSEQAARINIDRIRGQLLPDAELEATYSDRYDQNVQVARTQSSTILGRLNIPIYDRGGIVYSEVRQAKQLHLQRIQLIEQARATAQAAVVQAWSQLAASKAQLESDRAQIESNTTALNGVREEEKVGQRTVIEVLNAQQTLLNSQVQIETTKRNLLVSSYAVISAMGRLNVAEVGAASTVYDPEVHLDEVARKWWGLDITHDDGRREHLDLWNTRTEHTPVK